MSKVSASMLSCDFSCMTEEIRKMENAGVDMLHLDVMDGHFVPNLTFGAPVIKKLRPKTDSVFDVHLMISNPIDYVMDFADAGSDIITFHLESGSDPFEVINKIKLCNIKAGISIKPGTPAEAVFPYIELVDMVLVMTVEPGFGGQSFIMEMLPKIKTLKDYISSNHLPATIEVDGGITEKTAPLAVGSGADILVAGSYLFGAEDTKSAADILRSAR